VNKKILLSSAAALLAVSGTTGPNTAAASTISWNGTGCMSAPCSGSTTAIGSLGSPATINFNDNNITAGTMVSDDWTFSVPASVFSGSVTGDQIDLSSFQVSGTVDTFSLFSGTPGSGTLISSGTVSSPFSQVILGTLVSSGSYYLEIQAHANTGSIGSYGGVMVNAPIPLPASAWLLMSALCTLGLLAGRRSKDGTGEFSAVSA